MNPLEKIRSQINENLHDNLPKKWKKIGDILVADFSQIDKNELSHVSQVYADVLNVKTVLQKNIISGELRKPERIEILFGEDTKTEITEYGLKYKIDLSKTMWSPGNTGWRSILDGPHKVSSFYTFNNPKGIIDYFAGIGYFTIQLAKSYPTAKIISIDKNPNSIEYLERNLAINNIDNVEVLNDDCRNIERKGDVIHLGYISNTLNFLEHAYNNLNKNGIAVFHEAYNNSWLELKKEVIGEYTKKFESLMDVNIFIADKLKSKFYGPSYFIIALLRKK